MLDARHSGAVPHVGGEIKSVTLYGRFWDRLRLTCGVLPAGYYREERSLVALMTWFGDVPLSQAFDEARRQFWKAGQSWSAPVVVHDGESVLSGGGLYDFTMNPALALSVFHLTVPQSGTCAPVYSPCRHQSLFLPQQTILS